MLLRSARKEYRTLCFLSGLLCARVRVRCWVYLCHGVGGWGRVACARYVASLPQCCQIHCGHSILYTIHSLARLPRLLFFCEENLAPENQGKENIPLKIDCVAFLGAGDPLTRAPSSIGQVNAASSRRMLDVASECTAEVIYWTSNGIPTHCALVLVICEFGLPSGVVSLAVVGSDGRDQLCRRLRIERTDGENMRRCHGCSSRSRQKGAGSRFAPAAELFLSCCIGSFVAEKSRAYSKWILRFVGIDFFHHDRACNSSACDRNCPAACLYASWGFGNMLFPYFQSIVYQLY